MKRQLRHAKSNIIFSSIFFFFVVFLLLSLIVSSISTTFSQLFLVFSYPYRAYDFVSNILLLCLVCMCGAFCIHAITRKRRNTTEQVASIIIAVMALCVLIYRMIGGYVYNHIEDVVFIEAFRLAWLWNLADIGIYGIVYVGFIALPLLLPACKIGLNMFHKWGEWLSFYMPSINTTIFMLFAYAIQPYYGKLNVWGYCDLWLFYIGFLGVVIVLYRNRGMFGFYEYANVLCLACGVIVFSLCSKIIAQADYTNTRTIFIIIGLMTWCGEWMHASLLGDIKPSSLKSLLRNKT